MEEAMKIMNWFFSCYNGLKKRSDSNDQLPNIPAEIIFDILSNLPTKSLYRFRAVSKSWLILINDFIKARLENEPRKQKLIIASHNYPYSLYSLKFNSPNGLIEIENFSKCCLKIIGSFNGVILLCSVYASSDTLYFWNPRTRNYRLIPKPCNYLNCVIKGLAYDSDKNDFKVVMVVTDRLYYDKFYHARTYVFSSVSRSWKRIGLLGYHYSDDHGIVINGSPHWIVGRLGKPNVIVYFDPSNEKFGELPVPDIGNFKLSVLGGDLCGIDDRYDVWILKGSVWSKFFVTPRWKREIDASKYDDFGGEFVVIELNSHAFGMYNLKSRDSRREASSLEIAKSLVRLFMWKVLLLLVKISGKIIRLLLLLSVGEYIFIFFSNGDMLNFELFLWTIRLRSMRCYDMVLRDCYSLNLSYLPV